MTAQGIASVLSILSDIGVVGVAAFVIWGFLTERIVPKGRMEELRRDLDQAQEQLDERLQRMEESLRRLEK